VFQSLSIGIQQYIFSTRISTSGNTFQPLSFISIYINTHKYHGGDIAFKEITVPLFNKFRAYLKGTRDITERTIVNHLIVLRTIFNQAIQGNIVDQKFYPFGKGKIPIKFPDILKIRLTPDEVKRIEDLELPKDSYINNTRNVWLFSFYFAGMRVSDVLRIKWSDLQNDRLYYAMGKNAKAGSLKVPEKALKIISQYNRQESVHDLIFPDLQVVEDLKDTYKVQRRISSSVRRLNEHLEDIAEKAGIDKKMTMHIARHTFGNISGDKIPIQMLQKLYRHTSITTTIGYQANFVHKDADEALDSVVGF
jgi:integrase